MYVHMMYQLTLVQSKYAYNYICTHMYTYQLVTFMLQFNAPSKAITGPDNHTIILKLALQYEQWLLQWITHLYDASSVLKSPPSASRIHIPMNPMCQQDYLTSIIPKRYQLNKWRLITDLSHFLGHSVNDNIPKTLCSLSYITANDAFKKLLELIQPGTLLTKQLHFKSACLSHSMGYITVFISMFAYMPYSSQLRCMLLWLR